MHKLIFQRPKYADFKVRSTVHSHTFSTCAATAYTVTDDSHGDEATAQGQDGTDGTPYDTEYNLR